jgi:hypothetical protein
MFPSAGKREREENLFEKLRRKREDNIKIYITVAESWNVDWIYLSQQYFRMTDSCENDNELSGSITCGKFL